MLNSHWFDRLERRFGEWCVPQLASFIVGMNAIVWAMTMMRPAFPAVLSLEPELVMRGQVWRLFTFLLIPPTMSPIWMFFWLYILYIYASALEAEWGDFRFNLYYGIGAVSTILASMFLGVGLSNVPLQTSLFLAFAALYPDFEVLIMFILPAKVKWLAWLAWAGMAWNMLASNGATRVALAASLVNYAVFFGSDHWETARRWLKSRRK